MKKLYATLISMVAFIGLSYGQQVNIDKIDLMPNVPNPLFIQNWKNVASAYDTLVFSSSNQGTYLPLVQHWESGIIRTNEPSFGLPSYVGGPVPTRGEAINIIPALISASLIGIDKTNQFDRNWVAMIRDFFNPNQGVYVNNPGGKTGYDWWYDTMSNIFFYQLRSLYPDVAEFDAQFTHVADSWLAAVKAMGGSETPWEKPYMNYRAWNLETMEPLDEGVSEPEAAGAIGWLLYSAYQKTNEEKHRIGAEWCIEFLNSLNENPSYELQLPYGVYTAARMNAELGTNYDIEKMVNWCFNVGPLREWGAIIGTWNGNDVSGIIGEAKENYPDYAFFMNGAQEFGALVPMVRYDDRFARAIGKWALNVTNASRLFYGSFHTPEHQDNYEWLSQYDKNGGMAYEAFKETHSGVEGYATGDAMGGGWAETNLGLYGSSHAGFFGGVISAIHNDTILQLDLLKTDYYGSDAYPTYLFYNPLQTAAAIEIDLPAGNWSVYDATLNGVIKPNASNSTTLLLPANEGTIIVFVPSNETIVHLGHKSLAGGIVIDYNNGKVQDSKLPRLKSVATKDTLVEFGANTTIYCNVDYTLEQTVKYQWFIDGEIAATETNDSLVFKAGNIEKQTIIKCVVSETSGWADSAHVKITTIKQVPSQPQIHSIEAEPRKIGPSGTTTLTAFATDLNNDPLIYTWTNSDGDTIGNGSSIIWNAPVEGGIYSFYCKVTDQLQLADSATIDVLVRKQPSPSVLIAHYPFNGKANDISFNKNHGTAQFIEYQSEPNSFLDKSAYLNNRRSLVRIPNNTDQQGNSAIAIAFAFKINKVPPHEAFIVSHGSYQERWKFSISAGKLRFTMKTASGILDIDSNVLEINKWYEVVGQYSGTELELYLNKKLIAFKALNGPIAVTSKDISVGQMLPDNFDYGFSGYIDNLIFFNGILTTQEIEKVHVVHNKINTTNNLKQMACYPVPANNEVKLIFPGGNSVKIAIFSVRGTCLYTGTTIVDEKTGSHTINISNFEPGVYLLNAVVNNKNYTTKIIKANGF